jgi:hypothetical protein
MDAVLQDRLRAFAGQAMTVEYGQGRQVLFSLLGKVKEHELRERLAAVAGLHGSDLLTQDALIFKGVCGSSTAMELVAISRTGRSR